MKKTLRNFTLLISSLLLTSSGFAENKCTLKTTIQFDPAFIEKMANNLRSPAYLQWIEVQLRHGQNSDEYNNLLLMSGSKEPMAGEIPQHTVYLRKDGNNITAYWVKDNQVISKPLDFTLKIPDSPYPISDEERKMMQDRGDNYLKGIFSLFPDNGAGSHTISRQDNESLVNNVMLKCGCNLWKENDFISTLDGPQMFPSTQKQNIFPSNSITKTATVSCGSSYEITFMYQGYYIGRRGGSTKSIMVDKDISQTLIYPNDFPGSDS